MSPTPPRRRACVEPEPSARVRPARGGIRRGHDARATHQHVALTTGCARWDDGPDVVVEGEAVRVTDRAVLERLAERWRDRWDGRWRFTAVDEGFRHEEGGVALVFTVQPTKVLAFAKGTFAATRFVPVRR